MLSIQSSSAVVLAAPTSIAPSSQGVPSLNILALFQQQNTVLEAMASLRSRVDSQEAQIAAGIQVVHSQATQISHLTQQAQAKTQQVAALMAQVQAQSGTIAALQSNVSSTHQGLADAHAAIAALEQANHQARVTQQQSQQAAATTLHSQREAQLGVQKQLLVSLFAKRDEAMAKAAGASTAAAAAGCAMGGPLAGAAAFYGVFALNLMGPALLNRSDPQEEIRHEIAACKQAITRLHEELGLSPPALPK